MQFILKTYTIQFLLLLPLIGYSQKIEVRNYGISNGLSQSMITAICEDRDGFIWLGTLSGLNRFDGKNFKVFSNQPEDSFSPAGNIVTGILEDSKGRIWVGYNEGIDCYDKKTGRFYHLGSAYNTLNQKDQNTAPLFETSDGHIWLRGSSIATEMIVPDDFPNNPVQIQHIKYNTFSFEKGYAKDGGWRVRLYQTVGDKVCVEFFTKICYSFDRKTNQWLNVNPQVINNDVENSYCDVVYDAMRQGYWSLLKGKLRLIKNKQIIYEITLPPNVVELNEVHLDEHYFKIDYKGNMWFWTNKQQYPQLYRIEVTPDLSSNKIIAVFENPDKKLYSAGIFVDRQNTVWISTNGIGLYQIVANNESFKSYLSGYSLNNLEPKGKAGEPMFVKTDNKIVDVISHQVQQPIRIKYEGEYRDVFQVKYGSDGVIYATTKIFGISMLRVKYPSGEEKLFEIPLFRNSDPIFEDKHKRIWLTSSLDDFAYLAPNATEVKRVSLKHIWKDNMQPDIYIKQIYQSINDVFWIATHQGLVEMHAPIDNAPTLKLWTSIEKQPNSLSSNNIQSVLDDPIEPERYIWIATNGNGISKMDKQTGFCKHYTQKDGLANNVVYGILADKDGRLWLSTNYGISCFNLKNQHFRNFTFEEGLQGDEFNNQSYCKFSDGKMCFGGLNGYTIFNPDDFKPNTAFNPVFFTELKINNKPVKLRDSTDILKEPLEFAKSITLRYDQNFVSVSFSALNFVNSEKTTYFYKLEGIDADWVFADRKTEVSYPNLTPGSYVLYVANVNENGDKNPNPAQLTIIISPPWWRTWLAYCAYFLIFALGAYFIFKNQVNKAKMQNELLFKEKEASTLQEMDQLKTSFFTNITHEFRTPLTLIIEPTRQLLQQKELTEYNAQHRIILNNANRLLLLVNQLLDLSKIEGGKAQVNWAEGDLLIVIKDVFDLFEPIAAKNKQKLIWSSTLNELEGIIDKQVLEKIIYNLLSNAHKFTGAGGDIELSVNKTSDTHWQLKVRDTGIGIAKENLTRIFNRFYQADNSLTRRSEGTGIGLSLVKELVELLKGKISIESTLGKGTIFTIDFPIYPVTTAIAKIDTVEHDKLPYSTILDMTPSVSNNINVTSQSNQISILLVEDNAELRQFLNITLSKLNYSVFEAENGKMGLEIAKEILPDLIITDVMMPEMDGFQMTELLKNDMLTSHIPIVILTAKGRLESKITGYKSGADAYLPKPFNTEELMVRIEQLLRSRIVLQQKYGEAKHIIELNNESDESKNEIEDLSPLDVEFMNRIYTYIEANLDNEEISVESLTKELAMSRTQIFRKISALTGHSPAKLIRNYRLDAAMRLLSQKNNLRVTEVMHAVGFSDAKYFSKVFKEHFGVTPQSMRSNEIKI